MGRSRFYDDDRDDERRPRSSNQTLLLVLGLGGCLFCICIVVCGGLFYLGMKSLSGVMQTAMAQAQDEEDAEMAAEMFMQDVAANRLNEAYARTTKEYQARLKLAQFRDFVNRNPALKNYQTQSLDQSTFSPKLAIYAGSVIARNGVEVTFTVQLVKDATAWKIDRFDMR